MMPPRKSCWERLWSIIDELWYWCLLVLGWIFIMSFFDNFWADIAAGVSLIFVGWLIYKLKTKWLYSVEELCDLLFINTDKTGNKYFRKHLHMSPSVNPQEALLYLRSNQERDINAITIEMRMKKAISTRLLDALKNRVRVKRVKTKLYPYWWRVLRYPEFELHPSQPKIIEVKGIYLGEPSGTELPLPIRYHCTVNDSDCLIEFEKPIIIPIGFPHGNTIKVVLNLLATNEWRGVVHLLHKGIYRNRSTTRSLRISKKYGMPNE